MSRQISSLRAEVDYYKKELAGLRHKAFGLEEIVGESDAIRKLKGEIRKVSPLDVPVFISGESGSGKELVAHALHNLSRRSERPMVVVNCGALPSTLVESELFGYEAGAFTGARREGRTRQIRDGRPVQPVPRRDRRYADGNAGEAASGD